MSRTIPQSIRRDLRQAELARRMKTSRAVVHWLVDEIHFSVTLSKISKVAAAQCAIAVGGVRTIVQVLSSLSWVQRAAVNAGARTLIAQGRKRQNG